MLRRGMVLVGCWLFLGLVALAAERSTPNVVIIYADDLGYGDLGCYGAKDIATPHLDRMASEGVRFTDFYVAQPVCSASRTALLTGCYPNRLGILGALNPDSRNGIHPEETTLGQLLKSRGYATAIFGKWHLGYQPQFLPTRHGFDVYYGLPYSNDMGPKPGNDYPEVPLIENESILERNPDQSKLTTEYTRRAVEFIKVHRDGPFFLYMPHTMPHVPLHVSEKFAGKSQRGLYGDVIEEIDWSVGQILDTIHDLGLDEKTLVVFASDNGPWLLEGNDGGSADGLREGKVTTFEGGVRVPCIAQWPGQAKAGVVSHIPWMTIDVLPTLAGLIGADVPSNRPIDGRDAQAVLLGDPNAKAPHEALYFYWNNELQAVRSGRWKIHFPHTYTTPVWPDGDRSRPGRNVEKHIDLSLYDLESDPGEKTDVAADHPEIVVQLKALAERMREDLGDSLTNRPGTGRRKPGMVEP